MTATIKYIAKRGYTTLGSEVSEHLIDTKVETLINGSVDGLMEVFGSVTKLQVEEGAETVGYSGFTASDYLKESYNSAQDHDLNDFTYSGWLKQSTNSNIETLLFRGVYNSGWEGACVIVQVNLDGTIKASITNDGFITQDTIQSVVQYNTDQWIFWVFVRRGGKLELWVNGEKAANDVTITNAIGSMSNAGANLYIGSDANTLPNSSGTQAFIRVYGHSLTRVENRILYVNERNTFRRYSMFNQVGEEYTLNPILSDFSPAYSTKKHEQEMLDGSVEANVFNTRGIFKVTTDLIDFQSIQPYREFYYSVRGSERFQFQPGGGYEPNDIFTAVLKGNSFSEDRENGSRYFKISFEIVEQ